MQESIPEWIEPMLARLTKQRFSDPAWVFEEKLDGIRGLAYIDRGQVRLLSRNQLDLSGRFGQVLPSLQRQRTCILDGELVAYAAGRSSFETLQQGSSRISYHVFDILHVEGTNTRVLPLLERKKLLADSIEFDHSIVYTKATATIGETLYQQACDQGWEGIMAKRATSLYVSGRSSDWLKMKCQARQEFVIGGYTDPTGRRVGLGALLLGVYTPAGLAYAGLVGTGFNTRMLHELHRSLVALETRTSPFGTARIPLKGVHFVKPDLVAEVAFMEWTEDGKLRHPSFLGLRPDKSPGDVMREG